MRNIGREIDRRDFSVNRASEARAVALESLASPVSDTLEGRHHVRVVGLDAATGNAAAIVSSVSPPNRVRYAGSSRLKVFLATQPSVLC
jgi:hypothetical protein